MRLRSRATLVAAFSLVAALQVRSQQTSRDVSLHKIAPNILQDQKSIWLYPAKVPRQRNWVPVVAMLGATAALIAADPAPAHAFRNATLYSGFNDVFSSKSTAAGLAAVPVTLFAAGLLRHDDKMRRTALFAGEAVADAEIVSLVLKVSTRRLQPARIAKNGNFADSWLDEKSPVRGSFPSGHTIAAFSIATVIAHQYRNHRWVPYAAYGLASLVAFSRLSTSSHFLSDAAIGGVLGYSIASFAVLRQ